MNTSISESLMRIFLQAFLLKHFYPLKWIYKKENVFYVVLILRLSVEIEHNRKIHVVIYILWV